MTGGEEPTAVRVRPVAPEDSELLFRIFASTHDEEGAQAGWADARREALLRRQFEQQERQYHTHFPDAEYNIVLLGGAPVGRFYFQRRAQEYGLIDVTLFPNRRGVGIGAALVERIKARARADRLPVRLFVEGFNPARRLFERLGFVEIGKDGRYLHLEWRPEDVAAPPA